MKQIVTILFVLLFSTKVLAKDIVIAIADWPPYEYMDKNGVTTGLNVEIVQSAAKQLGINVEFFSYPWSRCLNNVKSGEVDAILSLYRTLERETFLYYVSERVSVDQNVLFTFHQNNYSFDGDLEKISGETVVVARNNDYGEAFQKADYIKKYNAENTEQIIRMIAGNRYSFGISSKLPLIYMAKSLHVSNKIKILQTPVSSGDLYLGFTKAKGVEYKNLAMQMSQAIKKIKQTEEYKVLLEKYGNSKKNTLVP